MVSYAWAAMTPGVIVTYFCLIKKWCHQRCHSCVSFSVQLDLQCQAYLLLSFCRLWLERQIFLIAIFLLARRKSFRLITFVARNSDESACVVLARLVTERIDIIGITTMISIRSHHLDEVLP